jgi:hypothetical protein
MSRHGRFCEAYLQMTKIAYRPAAPSDGFGNVVLSDAELQNQTEINEEATSYADECVASDDDCTWRTGSTNYSTNRATVYLVEAVRNLCSGSDGNPWALKLIKLAVDDIEAAQARLERAG